MHDSDRPHYHYSPPTGWMNDPNGLVYWRGEYHLFYQYHPDSAVWGPMHWGHAVSRDLVRWQHLPIALFPDEIGYIFSGSAVVDRDNTAGFGAGALVAIFTHHHYGERQSLAYSLDSGRTWIKYAANPVLLPPANTNDFRDPKVFWYGAPYDGHWVMCLTTGNSILFYTSPNLIDWQPSGCFGPAGATSGIWETPDLFELPLEGGSKTQDRPTRWVLVVSLNNGAPAGGSGTQYFTGHFDGQTFTSENPPDLVLWADFGADYYAPQSWSNAPDGRRIVVAWLNNWHYAMLTPASTWRGVFTLPRQLSLVQTELGPRLRQQPISDLSGIRQTAYHWRDQTVTPGENLLAGIQAQAVEINAEFEISPDAGRFGFHLRVGSGERTTVSYAISTGLLSVDRTASGSSEFYSGFAAAHTAALPAAKGRVDLRIFVDHCSLEVFANHGLLTFSELIFPGDSSQGLALFTEGGDVLLRSLDVYLLNSVTPEASGTPAQEAR